MHSVFDGFDFGNLLQIVILTSQMLKRPDTWTPIAAARQVVLFITVRPYTFTMWPGA